MMEPRIIKVILVPYIGGESPFKCIFCRNLAEYTLHLVLSDGTFGEVLGDYCPSHADAVSQEIQKGTLKVEEIVGA
jgi:hypothetical protein